MKRLLHLALMRVIPWRCWRWPMTSRLMRWNDWANREEFARLRQRVERED
jgi:hypothetical protein